jgi:superoxide dismutase, Cu-Zn family
MNGDGLVLRGRRLYVIRNEDAKIDVVKLGRDLRRGVVVGSIADPRFRFPTTGDFLGRKLLVVNGQLDKLGGTPTPPFTVSAVRVGK